MSVVSTPAPYSSSPVFDESSLPAALRRQHRTKVGVWGVIRVLEGKLKLTFIESGEVHILSPGAPGIVQPDQPHLVETVGPMQVRVDFYNQQPDPRHLHSGLCS